MSTGNNLYIGYFALPALFEFLLIWPGVELGQPRDDPVEPRTHPRRDVGRDALGASMEEPQGRRLAALGSVAACLATAAITWIVLMTRC